MIYLDHAAATPVSEAVRSAMRPYFSEKFFNPSAAYLPAKEVAAEYEEAKDTIAHAIGAKGNDLIMTAGATEANNLAFSCVSEFLRQKSTGVDEDKNSAIKNNDKKRSDDKNEKHAPILYLTTEHDSVQKIAEKLGGEEIKVDKNGRILLSDLREKITDETVLVSAALVNNELGTVQPIAEVAAILREVRQERLGRDIKTPLYLHSDASQAMNLLNVNVARLGVDLLTLNAAKIYGPKGVGALYANHNVRLLPLSYGGGQEQGLRSGTENVAGAIGFAEAVLEAQKHINFNRKKYAEFKKILLSELQGYELINKKHSLDNFVNLCYNGIDGERIIFMLENRGVYLATGAACAANKRTKSHVLAAIGLSDAEIAGSLRITLGDTNTKEQMYEAARLINEAVETEKRRVGLGETENRGDGPEKTERRRARTDETERREIRLEGSEKILGENNE